MSDQESLLDHITWHTLAGPHAAHSMGGEAARRYAPGFSPILGFAEPSHAAFSQLEAHCAPGEEFYTDGWTGEAPPRWRVAVESTMFKMDWDAGSKARDDAPEAVALQPRHAAQALELATLTHPGPFALRTIELGEYFGIFDGDRLIAMAGERMQAGTLHEISGVCTHPQFQGQGLARRLVAKLVARQLARGKLPFLHVMRENSRARELYKAMGFREYRESAVRLVERL